jgi:hypothetical protein
MSCEADQMLGYRCVESRDCFGLAAESLTER